MAKVETGSAVRWSVRHPIGDKKPISPRGLPSAIDDLTKVRVEGYGVFASTSTLYAGGVFNRDGIQSALHTLSFQPEIAEDVIETAVRLQGRTGVGINEEAEGKYFHERRDTKLLNALTKKGADRRTRRCASNALHNLSNRWGGDGKSVTFFGAADTTPALINLVAEYDEMYPQQNIWKKKVVTDEGGEITVGESVFAAMRYLTAELKNSDLGLLQYQHHNPHGIQNQYFKDSATSLIFADPEKHVNFKAPIAEIGIQGLMYDALEAGKRFLTSSQMEQLVSSKDLCLMLAKDEIWDIFQPGEIDLLLKNITEGEKTTFDGMQLIIQRQLFSRFWIRDKHYFASALDRDPDDPTNKTFRSVDGIASNPAALLNTGIFDDLTEDAKRAYIGGIAVMIMGPQFLTEAGHRGRAVKYEDNLQYDGEVLDDYHGVFVVWPNEVYNTAKGLERQGLYAAADQLKIRHTNAFNIAGSHNEYHLVDEAGRLQVHKLREQPKNPRRGIIYTLFNNPNHTEDTQTWGVTSNLALKRERGRISVPQTSDLAEWQVAFDEILIEGMQNRGEIQVLLKTREQIETARQNGGTYYTDSEKGKRLDDSIRVSWDCEPWKATTTSVKSHLMKSSA